MLFLLIILLLILTIFKKFIDIQRKLHNKKRNILFGFIKKIFIGLLSVFFKRKCC